MGRAPDWPGPGHGPPSALGHTLRPAQPAPTAVLFADRALFDLLMLVWCTGADRSAALDHLHTLSEPWSGEVERAELLPSPGR
ncbi:hypothetical protein RM572_27590 [Streptomyces sp. DSM 42041]|uniref:Uncharacterized protein n=1 Tax=Streptomyces hazeniae TaxID=3075538 RepID=A0ABU2NZV6_9ACTN|nr:hypothetical protein [Streptomyces sp. DSM 42041]MDT0382526.1 hypothetical protein [Streptomyces sp. DSM 42041]